MPSTPRSPVHPTLHFDRFLSSAFCRAVARFLIVTLLAWDLPSPRTVGVAQAGPAVLYVNATDPTCQGQSPCFPTIQQAIDAAQPGDTIRIQAGAYVEQLLFKGANATATGEFERIVVEADPAAPIGSVVLQGARRQCSQGYAIRIQQSSFVTIRGLTITGAGGQAIELLGGTNANRAIHLERNRIVGNGRAACDGGITISRDNPELVISNNLIYGNHRNGINFIDAGGAFHTVVNNTMWGNGWNGIRVTRNRTVALINNLVGQNGTARGSTGGRYGIVREAAARPDPAGIMLLHNLACGNRLGEIEGPVLDETDVENRTPQGTEGPGVGSSPGCEQVTTLFANRNGADQQPNTQDDDFTLAQFSPAIDTGVDSRQLGLAIAATIFEADYRGESARPADGDQDGLPEFDIGALEQPGQQCEPGTQEQCYSGPEGTAGVGLCQAGTRTCGERGTFGICEGRVLPQREVCNAQDDNCNGQTDEELGQTTCGVGLCLHTVDNCKNGEPTTCDPLAGAQPEICGNEIDEDCDGQDSTCLPLNRPPDITSTPVTTAHVTQPYSYDVEATDPDVGDTLVYELTTFPAGMTINPDTGLIEWTPTTNQAGPQDVTVQVSDGHPGGTDTQSFTVQVEATVNRPPVAQDNHYETQADGILTVPAPGVLGNDSDLNQDALTAKLVRGPGSGELDLHPDGSFTYNPLGSRSHAFVYCEDFEDAQKPIPEWSTTTRSTTPPPNPALFPPPPRRRFLGQFGNETVSLALANLPPHSKVTVAFNLFAIGSWDGNDATLGPDVWSLGVQGGPSLLTTTFSNAGDGRQAYPAAFPGGDSPARTGAENGPLLFSAEAIYPISRTFDHSDPTLTLDFSASGLSDLAEESWGIDNVCVSIGAPLEAKVELRKDYFFTRPESFQVMMAPAVADLDGDGFPEVVFSTFTGGEYGQNGILRAQSMASTYKTNIDLAREAAAIVTAKSLNDFSYGRGRALDGDETTSWIGVAPDLNFDIELRGDSMVRGIHMVGDRPFNDALANDFLSGNFRLFAADGSLLYDTGLINFPAPDREVTLSFPDVSGVRKVSFVPGGIDGGIPGFVEYQVFGDGPIAGFELFAVTDPAYEVSPGAQVAIGDIDLDGKPEIVAVSEDRRRLIAFENDGTFKWLSDDVRGDILYGAPSIADLDQDGTPEIIIGATALNNDGTLRWWGGDVGGQGRADGFGYTAFSTIADLDLDGSPEVVAGKSAYRANGALYWNSAADDGYPAVVNLDDDPYPEIAVVHNASLWILEHDGTVKLGPVDTHAGGRGTPMAADLDGDGKPEIGAQGGRYSVSESDGTLKWTQPTGDGSSVTGSSVFDFDGDGTAEVVYADERNLFIYRGATGEVLQAIENSNATLYELPVVADVDADGQAEIVVSANTTFGGKQMGITVVGAKDGNWVPTRKIWNQHTYHVTNVNDDGSIPRVERPNWLVPGLNDFRLNSFSPDDQNRSENFIYKATDTGGLMSNEATVTIDILSPNGPPDIVSDPPLQAVVGTPYSYAIQATDPDVGDELRYFLTAGPAGMTIDATTGLVQWTPTSGQLGNHPVTVRVQDRRGLTDTQSFTVAVTDVDPNTTDDDGDGITENQGDCNDTDVAIHPGAVEVCNAKDDNCNGQIDEGDVCTNHPPDITSVAVPIATVGQPYTYDVEATDPDNDTLMYALTVFPSGMAIDSGSGLIEWTPSEGQIGPHEVTVEARDPGNLFATQSFTIQVAAFNPNNMAPRAQANSYTIRANQTLTVPAPGVLGNDSDLENDPIIARKLTDPTRGALSFNADGSFSFMPSAANQTCTTPPPAVGISFTEPLGISLGSNATVAAPVRGLAKGDFNQDGFLDLAATGQPGGASGNAWRIWLTLGKGDGTFQAPVVLQSFAADVRPSGILAKDVDGDCKLDLFVAVELAKQVLFFKGHGDGTFDAAVPTALTQSPASLQSADLNGDGQLDLVTLNSFFSNENSVSVLLGNGNGTFQSPVNYAAGIQLSDMALGDVNGDTAPDIVVSSGAVGNLSVLLNTNTGSGAFAAAQQFPVNMSVGGFYLADFNRDTKLDVVLGGALCFQPNGQASPVGVTGCMTFIPGNGDGTFPTPPGTAPNTTSMANVAVRGPYSENVAPDVNGDGNLDVVFGDGGNIGNLLQVRLGNGDGTFSTTAWVASPGPAVGVQPLSVLFPDGTGGIGSVVVDDFTGDGVMDIATAQAGGNSAGRAALLPGTTPGQFAAPRIFPVLEPPFNLGGFGGGNVLAPYPMTLGDFTNDGQPELAVLGAFNRVGLMPLAPDGTLGPVQTAISVAVPQPGVSKILNADFDRDGKLDVVWIGNDGSAQSIIIVAYGNGAGQFTNPVIIPHLATSFANMVVADFNSDGFPDVAAYTGTSSVPLAIDVYLSTGGNRTFTLVRGSALAPLFTGAVQGMVAADFDHDGLMDVVFSQGFHLTNQPAGVQQSMFLRGNGDGSFQPAVVIASGIQSGFVDYAAADINHDDKLDLIGIAQYSSVHVQLGNGDGTFQTPVLYNAGIAGTQGQVVLADFDWDGHLDIALTTASLGNVGLGLAVLRGNGDGAFGSAQRIAFGVFERTSSALLVSDVNTDGRPDLIAGGRSFYAQDFTVLLNNSATLGACTFSDSFTYAASDGSLDSPPATVRITIQPVNHPPVITSTPVTSANTGQLYIYDVNAIDEDAGDRLAYALATAPSGMTIDPETGVIRWLPATNQAGSHAVKVRVYDSSGVFAEQNFTLTVTQRVMVPNLVGQTQAAAETAILGAGLTVGTITTRNSETVPTGNVISQTPAGGASAPSGSAVALVISLGPLVIDNLASILVEPQTSAILVGQTQTFTATSILNDGTSLDVTDAVTWDSSDPGVATINALGTAAGAANGTTTISATVSGVAGTAVLTVRTPVGGDTTAPTAAITSPVGGAEVTSLIDVIGTAVDTNFFKYELAYAPAGETNFTLLTSGSSSVINGVLGQFDPTVLLNDLYDVKLTVFDLGGNATSAMVTVQVAREKKVGLFSITFQDLNIPLSGIPITVNRTYDSRDKRTGDFGVGWRLDIQTLRIRTNRILGTGWVRNPGSFATIVLSPTDQHKVSLTLPDGKVEEFDLQVSPTVGIGALDFTRVVGFAPRPGTLGTLEALAESDLLIAPAGAEDELVDFAFNTYHPQLFRYTTVDGTQIEIHRTEGVKKVTDRNGNTLTFGPNGIIHSAGKSVTFTRDAQNRITQMTDPLGHVRTYAYDANGDLIAATDFVGQTTQFAYNRTHGLVDIVDPTGARVARNEYDASGRLVATIDAHGHRVEFTHNLGASQEIVKDRLGNITVFEYDTVGNVVAKTDALGGLTTYTHDSRGNELTQTDPLGRVATKTYDSRNNVLISTDFDGNTTISTYNSRSQVLTITDPEGGITTNVYDADGNLTQTTTPEGGVTAYTYDPAGRTLSATNPLGSMTAFAYDTFGNKVSETDPLGGVTSFAYNANGSVMSSTKASRTTLFHYDDAQRLVRTTDALGQQTSTTYSPIGDGRKIASTTDAAGQVTQFDYDVRGHRTRTLFPDGSTAETTYDAEGHPLSQTDRDGRTFLFAYDALGRQTRTTNPDGTLVLRTYDAIGRLLTQTNERNNVTTHGYAPNMRTVTNALGQMSVQELDKLGRSRKTTDALGHVTTFIYDGNSHLLETIFPDGTNKTATYNATGQKTSETDQAGSTTQFVYDALARLTQVTNAAGESVTYVYDALDNRLEETDAHGNLTRLAYDLLNRLTSRTRPLGQVETFVYDAKGNLTSHADFNGQTTTLTYDVNDNLASKHLPGGTVLPYAYTAHGSRIQAGDDVYEYDTRGRLIKETKTNGEILTYTYDAAGNKTSLTTPQGTTTYTYDALNRLATVVDATGTTTYTYDAVGNLASTAYPNGVTTTYSYDTLNRLVQMANTGPGGLLSSYTYTLGLAGNRLQVVEAGPATTGRTVLYSYDAVYRLTHEVIDEPGTANDLTLTYTYDAVGNRTEMARNGTVTIYSYDANDRLTSETTNGATTTYTYDDNGSLLAKSGGGLTDIYTYDAEKRLVSATVQSGASPGVVNYTYDADGMRTSKTAGGVTTTFLLDKNVRHAQVLVETAGGTNVAYSYGHDLLSQTRPSSGTRFYLYDGQLSTRLLTDTTGGVSDTYSYDAFGVMLTSTGSTPNVYLYTGEQLDPNVGFYYLRARYYDQAHGRFISTDPFQGNAFDPVSLHRYLYAKDNPVAFSDPSGQISVGFGATLAVIGIFLVILATAEIFARLGRRSVTARIAKARAGGNLPGVDKAIQNFIAFGTTPAGCSLQGKGLGSFLAGDQNCSSVEESLRANLVMNRPADDSYEYVRVNLFGKRTARVLGSGGNIDYHHAVGLRPKGSKGAPTLIFDPIRLGAFGRQAETGAFDVNSIFSFQDWYIAGSSRFGEVATISAIDNETFFEDPEVLEGQGRFDQLKLTDEATPH